MKEKFNKIVNDPVTREVFKSLKPKKSFWGIFGVIVFFILPEIVAFTWGDEITAFVQHKLQTPMPFEEAYSYKGLEMLFGKGSYLNLLFGVVLLIWLFF